MSVAWIHGPNLPCFNSSAWWCWCNGVRIVFLAHLGPLIPITHPFIATIQTSIVSEHVHPIYSHNLLSSNGYFQLDNAPFHQHDNELSEPHQSLKLNTVKPIRCSGLGDWLHKCAATHSCFHSYTVIKSIAFGGRSNPSPGSNRQWQTHHWSWTM